MFHHSTISIPFVQRQQTLETSEALEVAMAMAEAAIVVVVAMAMAAEAVAIVVVVAMAMAAEAEAVEALKIRRRLPPLRAAAGWLAFGVPAGSPGPRIHTSGSGVHAYYLEKHDPHPSLEWLSATHTDRLGNPPKGSHRGPTRVPPGSHQGPTVREESSVKSCGLSDDRPVHHSVLVSPPLLPPALSTSFAAGRTTSGSLSVPELGYFLSYQRPRENHPSIAKRGGNM